MHFKSSTIAALAAVVPAVFAQTSTDCNPLEKTCPSDAGINSASFVSDFTKGSSAFASWSAAQGTSLTYTNEGAEFIISSEGQAPTIQTDFYIFFGRVDVKMKVAPGAGIVSSVVLESDDLDEIDFEMVSTWSVPVETNYFGKGNTTTYDRAIYYPASNVDSTFHTYSVDWTSERIQWLIDGVVVRTINCEDANGGKNFPQTPMRLKMGNWCAGCTSSPQGTIDWAGGKTNWAEAPFTMTVASVDITNANPADSYVYGDMTGSWESIKIVKSGTTGSATGSAGPTTTVSGTKSSNISITAPTSSHSVAAIMPSDPAVSSTQKGSSYSMNTASASAINSMISGGADATGTGGNRGGSGTGSMTTSVTGHVSSSPTGGSNSTNIGGGSTTGPTATPSTSTNGASSVSVMVGGSLLTFALGVFML